MATGEEDDETAGTKERPSQPQSEKGTLLGVGAVKVGAEILEVAEQKSTEERRQRAEKRAKRGSVAPGQIKSVGAAEPDPKKKKSSKFVPPRPGAARRTPAAKKPPPPPPTGGPLSRPPPAPPPARGLPPSPIKGVSERSGTKKGMQAVDPSSIPVPVPSPDAPFPLAPSADRGAAADAGLDAAMGAIALPVSPVVVLGLVGGGVVMAIVLIALVISAVGGGDDEGAVEDGAAAAANPAGAADPTDEDGDDVEAEGATASPLEDPEAPLAATDPLPTPPALTEAQREEFEGHRERARELWGEARFGEAAAAYRAATELDPTHGGSFAGLGAALSNTGDVVGAVQAYEQAVRLSPDSSGYHAALGRVLRMDGQDTRAIAEYQRALELDANNGAARSALEELGAPPP